MTQKELKEIYKIELEEFWNDPKMVKYLMNKVAYIVAFDEKEIVVIDKPKIETKFYVGEGSTRSIKDAIEITKNYRTSEELFLKENLASLNATITSLEENINNNIDIRLKRQYLKQTEKSKLRVPVPKTTDNYSTTYANERLLSKKEKINLLIAYMEVKMIFEKRLNTYLKRYGLSKVKAETYWVDR